MAHTGKQRLPLDPKIFLVGKDAAHDWSCLIRHGAHLQALDIESPESARKAQTQCFAAARKVARSYDVGFAAFAYSRSIESTLKLFICPSIV